MQLHKFDGNQSAYSLCLLQACLSLTISVPGAQTLINSRSWYYMTRVTKLSCTAHTRIQPPHAFNIVLIRSRHLVLVGVDDSYFGRHQLVQIHSHLYEILRRTLWLADCSALHAAGHSW